MKLLHTVNAAVGLAFLTAAGMLSQPAGAMAFDVYNARTLIANAVTYAYAIPDAIDWDADGDWDLIVGEWGTDGSGYFGGIRLYLNTGNNAAPNFVFHSYLYAGGTQIRVGYG